VLSGANDKVGGLTDKISGLGVGSGKAVAKAGEKVAEGKSPLRAGLSAAGESVKSTVGNMVENVTGGGKGKGGGKKLKVTNIVEQIDVGAPIDVVYDQWTQFQEFSQFMKKVENVDQKDDQKLEFKAQVLWSHRTWQATILEQVPDEKIIWRSSGEKGRVDGAVTFHELAPDLTRVIVVLEYYPQGLFERTGNLWRAQGRRVRLELKHFQRHVMTHALLHPDDVEGWRGEIHDSKVTRSDEDARAEADDDEDDELEDEADEGYDDEDADEDESDAEDESDDDELEDEADDEYDAEDEDEDAEDEDAEDAEDEYDDEAEDDEAEDEDEDDAPRARPARRRGGRSR